MKSIPRRRMTRPEIRKSMIKALAERLSAPDDVKEFIVTDTALERMKRDYILT